MSSALLQHTFSDYRNYNKTRKIENYYILLVIKRSIRDIYMYRERERDRLLYRTKLSNVLSKNRKYYTLKKSIV